MKAVGFVENLSLDRPGALQDFELPIPSLDEYDLLVEVKAVSVNPVDIKVRRSGDAPADAPRILGWDAAGIVKAVGERATLFRPGDRVWYAGDITRPGSNSQFQAVDERIVGKMPLSLNFGEAASLPLTAITAWELLFDRLRVHRDDPSNDGVLLITGAAGGVGSILTQMARRLTGLTVIGTASRAESRAWVLKNGAHYVIDHSKPWNAQLADIGINDVSHVVGLNESVRHAPQIEQVLRPEGRFALIDDATGLDASIFKKKSISIHWELMFTRAMFSTASMARQGALLNRVATLVDRGDLRHTMTHSIKGLDAESLLKAHRMVEEGKMIGKVVLCERL